MASLDVESLFTNILLNETINNCVSGLHNKHLYNGKLSKRNFFKLLEIEQANLLLFLIAYFIKKLIKNSLLGNDVSLNLSQLSIYL